MPAVAAAPTTLLADLIRPAIPQNLSFLRRMVDLRFRTEWAVEPPCLDRLNRATTYYRMTVHHQGRCASRMNTAEEAAWEIQKIHDGHLKRRFGDIGYHVIIDRSGRAWEGRELCYMGAHVSEHNPGNLGVMLLGNFEEQRPSDAQLLCLSRVLIAVQESFEIPNRRVYGHRDLGHTLCPGQHLYSFIDDVKRREKS